MDETPLEAARQEMLRDHLQRRGIRDTAVLAAMAKVPRERFFAPSRQDDAYADKAQAIDCGQTISQPYIVGLMTQALELSGRETVLEIGTGSGYQTAILAELARIVLSIERHAELSQQAAKTLDELGYKNVRLSVGDGSLGWPDRATFDRIRATFDRIIVTAAAADCPPALFEQLAEGGTLVIPLGSRDYQTLQRIRKIDGRPEFTKLSGCRFVSLIGEQGWPEQP